MIGLFVFIKSNVGRKSVPEEKIKTEERMAPSQILGNKQKYSQQRVVIRGRVSPGPAVCERKSCPPNDSCCGCPSERNLFIADSGAIFPSDIKEQLRLFDVNARPFCRRRQLSCEYDCQDWVRGAIYDVSGVFFAEPPAPGWKLPIELEYYFRVEGKSLVKRVTFGESIGDVLRAIREMVEQFKTSGYYVLP